MSQNATDRAVDIDATFPSAEEVTEGSLVGCAGEPCSSPEIRDELLRWPDEEGLPIYALLSRLNQMPANTLLPGNHDAQKDDFEISEGDVPDQNPIDLHPWVARFRPSQEEEDQSDDDVMTPGTLAELQRQQVPAAVSEQGLPKKDAFKKRFDLLKRKSVYLKPYDNFFHEEDHPCLSEADRAKHNTWLHPVNHIDELMSTVYKVWVALMCSDDERISMNYNIYFLAYSIVWIVKEKICRSAGSQAAQYISLEELVDDKYNLAYAAVSLAITQCTGLRGGELTEVTAGIEKHFEKVFGWKLDLDAWMSMQAKIRLVINGDEAMTTPYDYIKLCSDFSEFDEKKQKDVVNYACHLCLLFVASSHNIRRNLEETNCSYAYVVGNEIVSIKMMKHTMTHEHPLKLGLAAFNAALFYFNELPERISLYVVTSMCEYYHDMPGCCGCGKMTDDISHMTAEMCQTGFKMHIGSYCAEISMSWQESKVVQELISLPRVLKKSLLKIPMHRKVPYDFVAPARLTTPKFEDLFAEDDPGAFIVTSLPYADVYRIHSTDTDMFDRMVLSRPLGETSRGILRDLYEDADHVLTTTDARAPRHKPRMYKRVRPAEDSEDDQQGTTQSGHKSPAFQCIQAPQDKIIERLEEPALKFRRAWLDAVLKSGGAAEDPVVEPEAPTIPPPEQVESPGEATTTSPPAATIPPAASPSGMD